MESVSTSLKDILLCFNIYNFIVSIMEQSSTFHHTPVLPINENIEWIFPFSLHLFVSVKLVTITKFMLKRNNLNILTLKSRTLFPIPIFSKIFVLSYNPTEKNPCYPGGTYKNKQIKYFMVYYSSWKYKKKYVRNMIHLICKLYTKWYVNIYISM